MGAAFGAAGERAPRVMETEPAGGCTGPAQVGGRVKRKPNIIDRVQLLRQRLARDNNRPVTDKFESGWGLE